jgi:phospholipase C
MIMAVVVLDPGHGGSAPTGDSSANHATSPSGLLEKDLVLAVAQRAAETLRDRGHTVHLTRDADVNLALADRAQVARDAEAAAFVSIHFNGFADPAVQGTETWVHLRASAGSQALADRVHRAVLQVTRHGDRGVQAKGLRVLSPSRHHARTAACQVELSFITTAAEDRRLQEAAYLQELGEAVGNGIADYLAMPTRSAADDGARAASATPPSPAPRTKAIQRQERQPDPIEHVVVLMLENRSFDHMVGSLRSRFPTLDGIDPANPGINLDFTDGGRRYAQAPTSTTALAFDPKHELANVRTQLDTGGPCGGFVTDFRAAYQTSPAATQEVMGYYDYGTLPVLHGLASAFTVCDRWFSSVPGPTWTNRLFVHSGTSLGKVEMPDPPFDLNLHNYSQDTIFDRLTAQNIPWRIYYGDVPQSLVLRHQWRRANALKYRRLDAFFTQARGAAEDFPAYAFIEPNYFVNQNDQHPPSDVLRGEVLLARVYNALRANEALWASTLLVILYDEHGGFYDHVYPSAAVPPDQHDDEYAFTQFGLRVPALLVSPWVAAGPYKTELDHTSLLKYLSDKWQLAPLGARAAQANSFADALLAERRTDTPERMLEPSIPTARAALAMPRREPRLNDLQRALLAMTEVLELHTRQPAAAKMARSERMLDGPAAAADAAQDRVERFLRQRAGVGREDVR